MQRKLLLLVLCLAALSEATKEKQCRGETRQELTDCVQCTRHAEEGCGWCLDPANQTFAIGCVKNESCSSEFFESVPIQNPNNNKQTQIEPSVVTLTTRPTIQNTIRFHATKEQDPVDVYFLLDLTRSMEKIKNKLVQVIENTAQKIAEKTTDYRFGFGVFSEKRTPPFNVYQNQTDFDFEHYQSMINDTTLIKEKIKAMPVLPGNKDCAEGGLDGLMQLLVCGKNEVGWREGVAKGIIIFVTNAPSHLRGDGLLGGLWKGYEHKCNLKIPEGENKENTNASLVYNSLDTDYPSVSSLRHELVKSQKSIIFGITEDVLKFYNKLTDKIGRRFASAGNIGRSGEGLENLIVDEFEKISSLLTVKIKNIDEKYVRAELDKEDGGVGGEYTNVTLGKATEHNIKITIKPEICNKTTNPETSFDLEMNGKTEMTIKLSAICECP